MYEVGKNMENGLSDVGPRGSIRRRGETLGLSENLSGTGKAMGWIPGWEVCISKGTDQWQYIYHQWDSKIHSEILKESPQIKGQTYSDVSIYLFSLAVLNVSMREVFELKQVLKDLYWFKYIACMN